MDEGREMNTDASVRELMAWLDAKITLDEEASDPDGSLAGLYEARKMAADALRRAAERPGRLHLTVWSDGEPLAALSGVYEGKQGMAEGFAAVVLTVADLLESGESGIQIEIQREEGENDGEDR